MPDEIETTAEAKLKEIQLRIESKRNILKERTAKGTSADIVKDQIHLSSETIHPSLKKILSPDSDTKQNPYLSSFKQCQKSRPSQLTVCKPGIHIETANAIRKQEQLELLQRKVEQRTFERGLSSQIVHDLLEYPLEKIPNVEWWDSQFVTSYDVEDSLYCTDFLTNFIYKPSMISNLAESHEFAAANPIKLTPEETKRKRKLARLEAHREKMQNIKLGILPPEKSKMRLASLPQVLSNQFVQDPTQLELSVKADIEERKSIHNSSNLERKLTPQEASIKKRLKFIENTENEIVCAVFKISGKGSFLGQWKFKIEVNARQNHLFGMFLQWNEQNEEFNCIIIVEGGPKGIVRYKRLLLERIKWQGDAGTISNGHYTSNAIDSKCDLLWEGCLKEGPVKTLLLSNSSRKNGIFESHLFNSKFEVKKYMEENLLNLYSKFLQ